MNGAAVALTGMPGRRPASRRGATPSQGRLALWGKARVSCGASEWIGHGFLKLVAVWKPAHGRCMGVHSGPAEVWTDVSWVCFQRLGRFRRHRYLRLIAMRIWVCARYAHGDWPRSGKRRRSVLRRWPLPQFGQRVMSTPVLRWMRSINDSGAGAGGGSV